MAAPVKGYTVEILVVIEAPDYAAADRIATDAKHAIERTNFRIRDGRAVNVIVSDIRSDDDEDGGE